MQMANVSLNIQRQNQPRFSLRPRLGFSVLCREDRLRVGRIKSRIPSEQKG